MRMHYLDEDKPPKMTSMTQIRMTTLNHVYTTSDLKSSNPRTDPRIIPHEFGYSKESMKDRILSSDAT